MEYTMLGTRGPSVSKVALGCMSFGEPYDINPWVVSEDDADAIFRRAVELGITFWDTANVYGYGTSESAVGKALAAFGRREEIVLATKVGLPMHAGPTGSGLSRRAIVEQLEGSLRRLGVDHVDLYQIHRFDPTTPVAETAAALVDAIHSGKARFLGASSMWPWQFAELNTAVREIDAEVEFVSMQDQYSLVMREEEREMFGLLADLGVSSVPWCPLAKGRLARPFGRSTDRSRADPIGERVFEGADEAIVADVATAARVRGVPMAQIALAWVMHNAVVAAPVVGATRPQHLNDAAAAVGLRLDASEMALLERNYTAREPNGF